MDSPLQGPDLQTLGHLGSRRQENRARPWCKLAPISLGSPPSSPVLPEVSSWDAASSDFPRTQVPFLSLHGCQQWPVSPCCNLGTAFTWPCFWTGGRGEAPRYLSGLVHSAELSGAWWGQPPRETWLPSALRLGGKGEVEVPVPAVQVFVTTNAVDGH